jgi:hypothetical protein
VFLLVAHFRLTEASEQVIPEAAMEALTMLAHSPECRRLHFARSTDTADRFVLIAEFDSAAGYRRSLSPWPMRTVVIPWLSTAELDVSEVSEVLYSSLDGEVVVSDPTVPHPGR